MKKDVKNTFLMGEKMIKNWTLEHFKSVYESTTLEMSPLTIFTGANSSGKSTILQSLLLTTQTLQNSIHKKAVILNGHIIKLGAFNDILSNNPLANTIKIGFELETDLSENRNRLYLMSEEGSYNSFEIKCDFSFSATSESETKDFTQLHPVLDSSEIEINKISEEKNIKEYLRIKREDQLISRKKEKLKLSTEDIPFQDALMYSVTSNAKPSLYQFYRAVEMQDSVGAEMFHFLPRNLLVVIDTILEEAKQIIDIFTDLERGKFISYRWPKGNLSKEFIKLIIDEIEKENNNLKDVKMSEHKRNNLASFAEHLKKEFTVEHFFDYIERLPRDSRRKLEIEIKQKEKRLIDALTKGRGKNFELLPAETPADIEYGIDVIRGFFSEKVKYLGPLRDEPKPVYPYSGTTDSKDVGFKGEHTAAVLEIHKNTVVKYISPNVNLENGKNNEVSRPLIEAVLEWLEYMGVVKDVQTTDMGKLGHELKVIVEDGSGLHDLTNVGVGVSQVLPILVLSLLAEKGSTLIFEQPELHLHPKVQTRLADFFVSMIQLNKQCIVESHSEYLINRLRYKAVITDDDSISKSVMIYFVEKELGKSQYNQVRINEYGVIEEWPKGFFDENEANSAAILRAAMAKKKSKKK